MFQKLRSTKDNIDNTTVEGSVIRDTSVRAKNVLNKAEEIHENVDTDLTSTVGNFESGVEEHMSEIPTEPIYIADFALQTEPSNVNQAVQYEANVREVFSQTTPHGTNIAIQTDEIEPEVDDGAVRGFVAQRVDEYEKLYPYQE